MSRIVCLFVFVSVLLTFNSASTATTELPFLDLGDEARVFADGKFFGVDDGTRMLTGAEMPSFILFPFGNNGTETRVFISSNGLISFGASFTAYIPRVFPILQKVVAPYWDDIDLRGTGLVLYATLIQGQNSRLDNSQDIFDIVNGYITDTVLKRTSIFQAQWILAVRWIDVCPYSDRNCIMTEPNTFQAVLATDGTRSYAIFTYECGELNWIHHSAAIGFSASHDFFAEHPLSRNTSVNDIACINEDSIPPSNWSNVVYEISNTGRIFVNPSFGNREGGTGVVVTGPRFISTDNVTCIFGGQEVEGVVLSDDNAVVCTTPRLSRIGRIPVMIRHNQILLQKQAYFYSVPFERGSVVDIETDSLLLKNGSAVKVKWPRDILVPSLKSIDTEDGLVDIKLYERNLNSESQQFRELGTLASNIPNTGEIDLVIPDFSDMASEGINQVSINVEVKSLPTGNNLRKRQIFSSAIKFSIWTGAIYLGANVANKILCQTWVKSQPPGIGEEILDLVSMHFPCPPTLSRAEAPNSGFETDSQSDLMRSFFHPNTFRCVRQSGGFELTKGYGNQCCYDKQGDIIVGPPGGGTVDKVAPRGIFGTVNHFLEDVLPFIWCCKGVFSNCRDTYYKFRPSDDGSRYNPPPPACVYGDPHLVTLDLHKYTFNGYGEFVLIETMDNSFTLQGRMIEATTNSTLNISSTGTIFSALAAEESHSDTVQLQLDPLIGISTLVNEERIDFTDITEQEFNNVTVADLGNRTIAATFSSGAFLKVQEENGIISVLIVSLPSSYRNKTRGLMGNGDKSDDLIPKGESESLPLDSTLQDIHNQFGMTWIISNEDDSLFFYEDNEDWATFYRPQYTPLFGPIFKSPELEEAARKLCKNDTFCLYDIAATGRVELGMTTLRGSEEFEELVELSAPVVCNPSCQNGACVDSNTCRCSEGYTGQTCDTAVYTECTQNPCQNQGTCQLLAGSYSCVCMSGYTGNFCEDDTPTTSAHIPTTSVTASTEPTSNQISIIIGATIGSIAAVLCILITTIVIIIAAVMWYGRRNKSKRLDIVEEKGENCNTYEFKTY